MAEPRRRVPDRKAQLVGLAAELFGRHGYHEVGVQEIAAAAGLTGPAVYRHFPSKQAILAHALLAGVDAFAGAVEDAFGSGAADPLGALSLRLAELSVEHRETLALWRWQGRHLADADQALVVQWAGVVMERWIAALRAARPELSGADAALLCWAAMSVFGSVAVHHVSLPRARFSRLLAAIADAVLATPALPTADLVPAEPEAATTATTATTEAAGRREALLAGATRLFRERGYHAVSMEEIGAAGGIAGPSVYRHFGSKAELLAAACHRMADRLAAEARAALATAAGPADALHRLVRSYTLTALANRDLLAVYAADSGSMAAPERAELIRLQREYVAGWVAALRAAHPGLAEPPARIAVHVGLTIVNDLVRTHRLLARPHLAAELVTLVDVALSCAVGPDKA
jgi:AcrR family transcriptional regulator